MKKYISICLLWMFCITLYAQNNGYGGNFDPANPPNPNPVKPVGKKYALNITVDNGGSVSTSPSESTHPAGTSVYLNATPASGYKFKRWLQGDSVISVSQWYYYTMPAKDVDIKAEFVFEPDSPDNPNAAKLSYRVSAKASSNGGYVYCSSEKVKEGTYTYVSATPNAGYKFTGWWLDGKLVSTDSYYYFEMEGRNMEFIAQFEFEPGSPGNPNNNPNNNPLYTIEYKIDGMVCHVEQLPAGATITAISTPTKEGHTFSGWSEIPVTMPAENIVIEGTFYVNSYVIIYKVDGEVYETVTLEYGTAIELIGEPTKEGHTFSGWKNVPETMPAKDIVIEGTFSINSYAIIYKVDGEVYATDSVVYGGEISLRDEPVKEGHTFSGWSESPVTMPAKDVVIEGSFTVNSYKVTYVIGEEKVYEEEIAYGDTIVPPTKFEKEGYKLTWNNLPVTMPAKDIVVEGSYSLNKYLVTYLVDGEVYATDSVEYGASLTLPDEPTKEGHSFVEWEGLPESMPANDITVNAKFSINSYKVTYIVDGETFAIDSVAYATKIQLRDEPVKEGYTFSGWSEAPETMPANDITIEGTFTVNSYKVTYIVDGEVYATDSITYCSEIVLRDEPTKEGHTFSGWSEAPETMPAEDITIEGTFSVNSYTITYKVDGEVYATDSIAYGSEIVLRDEPTKEGHTFSGWSEAPETMPAEDITITGSFEVNTYAVTYIVDDEVYATDSVAYGSEIVLREEPAKEGHTFSGWSGVPETMPAEDITITGSFAVNTYAVTYIVDGEVYATDSIAYGSEIVLRDEPAKEGHTFSGWSEVPETMPAEDIVIEGSFSVNSYTITYKVDGEVYDTITVEYGTAIEPIEEPAKEGHTFSGWSDVPETMPANDITIEGTFSINSYTVTFIIDGEVYETATVEFGAKIELPTPPEKEGYIFSGWVGVPDTMPAEDIVIEGEYIVDTTGINDVKAENGKVKGVYDLQGRKVDNATNGIYIINGKKTLIK